MNILHVVSSDRKISGVEIYLMTLGRELAARGDRVLFSTFEGRGFGDHLRREGFEVRPVRVRFKVDPIALGRLMRLCRSEQVDVIHTHLSTSSVIGTLAGRLAGVPCVSTVHGLNRKWSFLLANRIIAVSEAARANLLRQGVSESKLALVRNGVPCAALRRRALPRAEARQRLGLPQTGPVMATVATVVPAKGHACALEALGRLKNQWPDWRYLVVGDGPARPELEAAAQALGIADKVLFLGARDDVPEILSACDLFVFPSWREALPLALLEAMALGLPVAASAVGGIPEVVTPETGRLAPAQDAPALATAIREILAEPARASAMGEAGRRRAEEHFDLTRMVDGTRRVYEELCRRSGKPA